jgi:hypothetical protein
MVLLSTGTIPVSFNNPLPELTGIYKTGFRSKQNLPYRKGNPWDWKWNEFPYLLQVKVETRIRED